jgi:hypothetical protein
MDLNSVEEKKSGNTEAPKPKNTQQIFLSVLHYPVYFFLSSPVFTNYQQPVEVPPVSVP